MVALQAEARAAFVLSRSPQAHWHGHRPGESGTWDTCRSTLYPSASSHQRRPRGCRVMSRGWVPTKPSCAPLKAAQSTGCSHWRG